MGAYFRDSVTFLSATPQLRRSELKSHSHTVLCGSLPASDKSVTAPRWKPPLTNNDRARREQPDFLLQSDSLALGGTSILPLRFFLHRPRLKKVRPVHLTHTEPLISRLLVYYLRDREDARMRTTPLGTPATFLQVGLMGARRLKLGWVDFVLSWRPPVPAACRGLWICSPLIRHGKLIAWCLIHGAFLYFCCAPSLLRRI